MKLFTICLLLLFLCSCSSQKKFAAPPFGGRAVPVNHSLVSPEPDTSLIASVTQNDVYVPDSIVKEDVPLKPKILKGIAKKASKLFPKKEGRTGLGGSITSFVLGLVGLVFFGIIFGILAIIFAGISISKWSKGQGFAIAGLVLGIIDVITFLVILLIFLSF